jgi:RNA polymerase sigma-54 factor
LYSFPIDTLTHVLKTIQTFDPPGVAAQNLKESLLIQLKLVKTPHQLAENILENHFENLLSNRIPLIRRSIKCSDCDFQKALKQISLLNFHPGNHDAHPCVQTIYPDALLKQEGDTLVVELVTDALPSFRINRRYLHMMENDQTSEDTKEFIRKKMSSAQWLLHTIHQRHETLERVLKILATKQKNFFIHPEGKLVPMTMNSLANELEVHESTIARTVANKYIDTPRGVFSLRSLFTAAMPSEKEGEVSSHEIKSLLLKLIEKENKCHPLSDDAIAHQIQSQGIHCARRTIAKYRHLLKIGNTRQRRKY